MQAFHAQLPARSTREARGCATSRVRVGARAAPAPRPPAPRRRAAAAPPAASAAPAAAPPAPAASLSPPSASELGGFNAASREARLEALEESALATLRTALSRYQRPVLTCALIAGDVVLLHLLHRLGALGSGRVPVVFIDTLHLFPETHAFLARCEAAFGFTARSFRPAGFDTRAQLEAVHGAELWKADVDKYDAVCKVEPFSRALRTLRADCMLNGRRRDHGFERSQLEAWEAPPQPGGLAKCQPLAFWEFRDCFAYLEKHGVEAHPLHAAGYPSVGDAHSTVPVPVEKWFEHGGERAGRFQGLVTKDGKPKTECGIHVDGAARPFERDLWVAGGVETLGSEAYDAGWLGTGAVDTLLVVYAPWCPFCQAMEAELQRLADAAKPGGAVTGLRIAKLRGDTERDFVRAHLATTSFPTILAFPVGWGGKRFVKYEEEARTAEALLAFVDAACGTARRLRD